METREYRTVDKSEWGKGPWQDEPDKRQWTDEATGLPSLIVRGPVGALCGYVGVTEGHPLFGAGYMDDKVLPCGSDCGDDWHYECRPDAALSVHGGVTFSGFCQKSDDESQHVCHVPGPGETDRVWWFGFDCAHCDDFAPSIRSYSSLKIGDPTGYGTTIEYRDVAYVTQQCADLAKQLAAMAA